MKRKKNILIDFLWGIASALLFSRLIVDISFALGFPFMLPEIFWIPVLWIYRKHLKYHLNYSCVYVFAASLFFLFVISVLLGEFTFVAILQTLRGYLYLLLSFSYFYNQKIFNIDRALCVISGALFGWILSALANFKLVLTTPANASSDAVSSYTGNIPALILALAIPFIWNKGRYFGLFIALVGIIIFLSGMRRLIVVAVLAITLLLIVDLCTGRLKRKYLVMLGVTSLLIVVSYSFVADYLAVNAPLYHRRLIEKSEVGYNGDSNSSDAFRYETILNFGDMVRDDLYPKGFVSKRSIDGLIYIDFPIYEMSHMLGIPIFIVLMICFFHRIYWHFRNYKNYGIKESALCVVSSVSMVVLLFIEGSFLNYPFATPFTGGLLARIFSNKNLIK